jgi:hypothetical protein
VGIMAALNLPYPKAIDRALPANINCGGDPLPAAAQVRPAQGWRPK